MTKANKKENLNKLINEKWVSRQELCKIYGFHRTAFYRRRNECLASPYSDAVIRDGNFTYIDLPEWRKFLLWKARKKTKEEQGLQ